MLRQRIIPKLNAIEMFSRNLDREAHDNRGMRKAPLLFDPFVLDGMKLNVSRSRTVHTAGLRRPRNDISLFHRFAHIRPKFVFRKAGVPPLPQEDQDFGDELFAILREQEAGRKTRVLVDELLEKLSAERLTVEQVLTRLRSSREQLLTGSHDPQGFLQALDQLLPLRLEASAGLNTNGPSYARSSPSLVQLALNNIAGHGLSETLEQIQGPLEQLTSPHSPDSAVAEAVNAFMQRPALLKSFVKEFIQLPELPSS